MKAFIFRTSDLMSQWIEGVEFRNGYFATGDESKAEELRRNRHVVEIFEEEKTDTQTPPKEPKPKKPRGK